MRIGLATLPMPLSLDSAVHNFCETIVQAASFDVELLCFPEAYLPGMRGQGVSIPFYEQAQLQAALTTVGQMAGEYGVGVIVPMEWPSDHGRYNLVHVISPEGNILGRQCKTQLDPSEDDLYVPGRGRQVFDIGGVKFGVAICHEGWRYPETVRWAASRGAQIVFHPQCTGSDQPGRTVRGWADPDGPYYEKAMICRAVENGIYFASVNYAFASQDSATSVIGPDGACLAHQPYGQPGLLVQKLEMELATGQTAKRYAPDRY